MRLRAVPITRRAKRKKRPARQMRVWRHTARSAARGQRPPRCCSAGGPKEKSAPPNNFDVCVTSHCSLSSARAAALTVDLLLLLRAGGLKEKSAPADQKKKARRQKISFCVTSHRSLSSARAAAVTVDLLLRAGGPKEKSAPPPISPQLLMSIASPAELA